MNKQILHISVAFTLLLGIAVFVFFGYFYRFHLLYQEQLQMFLFTSDYLADTVAKPGGFSEYVSRFLTQFYYKPLLGAVILSILLMLMQRTIQQIALLFGDKSVLIPLTFIPSLFYWVLLCEEHYMLAGVLSILFVLSAFLFYSLIPNRLFRIVYLLVMIPALYWLAGGTYILLGIFAIVYEAKKKEIVGNNWLYFSLTTIIIIILPPLLTGFYYVGIGYDKVFLGADFYRFKLVHPPYIWLVWICLIVIPLLFSLSFKEFSKNKFRLLLSIQILGLALITGYGIKGMSDFAKEEVMAYDYYIRTKQWSKVIELADKNSPSSPLSVACLNLALCKKGRMGDDMFKYYQNGLEGLMPTFVRDFTIPMITGEIYYHLGFINTAQRYAFEAMEAIPDYQKSTRSIKRLAETNLINGEYNVARKYLNLLQHTFFYRIWAEEALTSLDNEALIQKNPEWSELRKVRTKTDFLFSDQEKDMMLGILLQQGYANKMAYEYLLAYTLLTKNLQQFIAYYPLGKDIKYDKIPKSYQEALIYIWGLTNNDPTQNIPYAISDEVKRNVQAYGKLYTSYQDAEPMLKQYTNTYWYYLHFRQ